MGRARITDHSETTWQQKRASIARRSQGLPPDHPELVELRRKLKTQRVEEYIERVLSEAPPLTADQRARLAELLQPVRGKAGALTP
jgi:hypothetical protein